MRECPYCGEFWYCNNGEGCDTCKYREELLEDGE